MRAATRNISRKSRNWPITVAQKELPSVVTPSWQVAAPPRPPITRRVYPRAYQEIIERQNIFDGTWEKTPSMGWMFVPLTEYQGGGTAATIEPLKGHLPHYEQRLANLFGAGVIACYRGPRLYDNDETKAV